MESEDSYMAKLRIKWGGAPYFLRFMLVLMAALMVTVVIAGADTTAMPDWLEPRGISVIELVGQVPDEYLQGTILSYTDGEGIVVYESGKRVGATVTVVTTLYPRVTIPEWSGGNPLSSFGCLGQTPHYDHQGTMVSTSTLRVFDSNGQEVTANIYDMYVSHMDILQPLAGSTAPFRYPKDTYGPVPGMLPLPLGPDGLAIPPNSGCRIEILGEDYRTLTGVFTLEFEPAVQAIVVGTQEAIFQSYIGVGWVGIFSPLMEQMRSAFGDRHARIHLNAPAIADSYLLRFPPMPGDPYTDRELPYRNADRPSGGSYRLSKNIWELSTDTTFSAIFPVEVAWKDSDQAGGREFLPVMRDLSDLAPPEYVIPAGVPYNQCFTQGDCSSDVLQSLYDAEMTLEIVYLQVMRQTQDGEWVPVKAAGPEWSPDTSEVSSGSTELPATFAQSPVSASAVTTSTHQVFLPYIARGTEEPLPSGCPCGYFDSLGRMLDFYPGEAVVPKR
jgi:hypothetical protein